jgi:hypothetical protein
MARRRTRTVGVAAAALLVALGTVAAPPAVAGGGAHTATAVALDDSAVVRSRIVDGTTVVTRGGRDEPVLTLPRPLQVRAVEPGGERVVLGPLLARGANTYEPGGRESTTLVVADLVAGTSRTFELPRNVEPEAFGVGAGGREQLFVVDHRPAAQPVSYRVGAVNLVDGSYHGLSGPGKQPLDIDMTGVARKQVLSAGGTQLYTLYLRHGHSDAEHHDAEHGDDGSATTLAFVHVLDLSAGWAYCVDLPGVGHGPTRASSIALSDDGSEVVVTDRHAGKRVLVDVASLDVGRLANGESPVLAEQPIAQ